MAGINFLSKFKRLWQQLPTALNLSRLRGVTDVGGRLIKMRWPTYTIDTILALPERDIFLTGIESSDPYVGNGIRRSQLREAHNFYEHFEERLENIQKLGIRWLRFGPPYSEVHMGPNQFDFLLMDKVVQKTIELDITLIVDLLHFGIPEWQHAQNPDTPFFQNSNFPDYFAAYARTFALRYPQIRYFTLINEPFVTANFSAKWGIWNEMKESAWDDDRSLVKAVTNIARAAILARKAIEQVWKELRRPGKPIFVQNESFEKIIAAPGSAREQEAVLFNLRRFAALDLIFGHADKKMEAFLLSQGMTERDYAWFIKQGSFKNTILGIDHYPHCVQILETNQVDLPPLERYQLYELTKEYWHRYKLPLLHTEVNAPPEFAESLCKKTYEILKQLKLEGYPIVGMGWYGDEYFYGWDQLLRDPQQSTENLVGLHYKGQPQPVASLFSNFLQVGLPQKAPQPFRLRLRHPLQALIKPK